MTPRWVALLPWGLPVIAGAYVVAGKLGLMLATVHPNATTVSPATGIALAGTLLLGYRVWPALFLSAFLVNITTAGSVWTSLGIAAGNTLEAVLGAWLVRRFANGPHEFDRARDIFVFAVLAGLASPAVGATVGVTSLSLGGYARWQDFGAIWQTWWLGDVAGALVVAPVLVFWGLDHGLRLTRARALELVLIVGGVVLVGGLVFGALSPLGDYPLTFLCVPPLVVAAFRFGQREAATCVLLLSGIATWGTLRGAGPFVRYTQNESLMLLESFMTTMAMMALLLAAASLATAHAAAIVESSDDAIIGKALDGIVTSWNAGAKRLYGYSAREVVGKSLEIIFPPERVDELPKLLAQVARGERVDNYETVRLTKDGRRVDVSVTVSPIMDAAGRIVGASAIARDITHRKLAEAAVRERDALRYVASLASAAAHEINNPLAVIVGQTQLIAAEVDGIGPGRIEDILRAVGRIGHTIRHLKRVSRLELTDESHGVPEMIDLEKSSPPDAESTVGHAPGA